MSSSPKVEPIVSVRIVSADYYMSNPISGLDLGYSIHRGLEIKRVPVIRIFGSTSSGFKVCLHVHGVFPYFYIPYDGSMPSERMGHQIAMALDKAINILQGQGTSTNHHIFKSTLVSGVPIYGYHRNEHQLFKIYFYNPVTRKHSYELLLNGAVMRKILQPYEAHIPFILQFLIDFNLQGMNFVHLKSAKSRRTPDNIPVAFPPSGAEPTSTCEMEIDCLAQDILNSLETKDGVQMNPGLAALWEEEIQRRRIKNINVNNIGPPSSQIRTGVLPTSSHVSFKQRLEEQLLVSSKEEKNQLIWERLRLVKRAQGDVSLSFHEVNEHLETTLPIETPDEIEQRLSASTVDFHDSLPTAMRPRSAPLADQDLELLDILCDLADEHGSSILEASIMGDLEEGSIDDDSILGTQATRPSQPSVSSGRSRVSPHLADDSDDEDVIEDRETLEMSQIFDMFQDTPEQDVTTERVRCTSEDVNDPEPISSGSTLPNLDGADDSSSDDGKGGQRSAGRRRSRTYKPLAFRFRQRTAPSKTDPAIASTSTARHPDEDRKTAPPHVEISEIDVKDSPSATPLSETNKSSRLEATDDEAMVDSETEIESSLLAWETVQDLPRHQSEDDREDHFDALFKMSLLSPPELLQCQSPPRPDTPTDCTEAQVVIRPILEDVATYEKSKGKRLSLDSSRVVLKTLDDEMSDYQSKTGRTIRLAAPPPSRWTQLRKRSTEKETPSRRKLARVENKRLPHAKDPPVKTIVQEPVEGPGPVYSNLSLTKRQNKLARPEETLNSVGSSEKMDLMASNEAGNSPIGSNVYFLERSQSTETNHLIPASQNSPIHQDNVKNPESRRDSLDGLDQDGNEEVDDNLDEPNLSLFERSHWTGTDCSTLPTQTRSVHLESPRNQEANDSDEPVDTKDSVVLNESDDSPSDSNVSFLQRSQWTEINHPIPASQISPIHRESAQKLETQGTPGSQDGLEKVGNEEVDDNLDGPNVSLFEKSHWARTDRSISPTQTRSVHLEIPRTQITNDSSEPVDTQDSTAWKEADDSLSDSNVSFLERSQWTEINHPIPASQNPPIHRESVQDPETKGTRDSLDCLDPVRNEEVDDNLDKSNLSLFERSHWAGTDRSTSPTQTRSVHPKSPPTQNTNSSDEPVDPQDLVELGEADTPNDSNVSFLERSQCTETRDSVPTSQNELSPRENDATQETASPINPVEAEDPVRMEERGDLLNESNVLQIERSQRSEIDRSGSAIKKMFCHPENVPSQGSVDPQDPVAVLGPGDNLHVCHSPLEQSQEITIDRRRHSFDMDASGQSFSLFMESSQPEDSQEPGRARFSVDASAVFEPERIYTPAKPPPSRQRVISTLELHGIMAIDNGRPFWGDTNDEVRTRDLKNPGKVVEVKGKSQLISSRLVSSLPEFGGRFTSHKLGSKGGSRVVVLTPTTGPPSAASVVRWLREREAAAAVTSLDRSLLKDHSQLEAPTLSNSFGFRVSIGNCQEAKAVHQHQYLTVMCMELHVKTRQQLRPDPEFDAITAVFYALTNDVPVDSPVADSLTGAIVVDNDPLRRFTLALDPTVNVTVVDSELSLFQHLIELVRRWNPDIVVGYEIELLSWGYVLQRGTHLGLAMGDLLSRLVPSAERQWKPSGAATDDVIEGGYTVEKNSDITIGGRIVLNLWRILRSEVAVQSYTFENMAFHILHRRVATYPFEKLTCWWCSDRTRWQVVEHYVTRVRGSLELMERLDLIGRTSELARLFGIQFYEVFTRGSQFRVESMMLRLAKPKNFVAVSPSVQQRARMKAPEWLALTLEPQSAFYTDPVLVLDFQSLYPSVIIAYNYCYSTCLGRVHTLGRNEPMEFGCTQLLIPPDVVRDLVRQDAVNISPGGVVFVKPLIRKGVLPQMLSEILDTRIMVKQSMKEYPDDNSLRRVLEARQMGLKLIANVTYGYTSANFSGRMPCVEVGDSVVSKGRETLERCIDLIEGRPEWGARVVYGDTDSVFVLLPGKSKDQAFGIGDEMARAVTLANPKPVKLKFEKVYQPCILQTKKRYVGYKYESANQTSPIYEAKGIETVRRDGCPAVVKILERSLRLLFEGYDVSRVKAYVQRQFSKILQNRVSIQDYIFAKEYRGRHGYKPGAVVPGLELSKQLTKEDRRSEPRCGERVPYLIVYGSPGVPLIRLVVPAQQLLNDSSLRLNAHYYISRAIAPALQRCFGLLGVDVLSWYQNLPRTTMALIQASVGPDNLNGRKATISQYFATSSCLLCDEPIQRHGLCAGCCSRPQWTAHALSSMLRLREKDYHDLLKLCRSCTGTPDFGRDCLSMDCPVLYRRTRARNALQSLSKLEETLSHLF